MEKLRAGVIGCGWVSDFKHFPLLSKHPEIEVTAVCDIDVSRAKRAVDVYGLSSAKIYEDYKELCQDTNVDVVFVLTPNSLHAEMTILALESGKHVLVEKPMATTGADAKRMAETARRTGKKLTIGHQWRFLRNRLYIKQLVETGMLGDIYYAKANDVRYRGQPYWGQYLSKKGNGGGEMLDGAPHALDLTMWLMDNFKPVSVKGNVMTKMNYAFDGNSFDGEEVRWDPNHDVEDTGFALITMENGAVIYLEAAWSMNMLFDDACVLVGTKAGIDMGGPCQVRINQVVNGKQVLTEPQGIQIDSSYTRVTFAGGYELDHFIDAIKNDKEPIVTPEQGVAVTQVLEGIYISSQTGETYYIS